MNILVVGFYGVLNAGDDLLQNALTWLFQGYRLTFTRTLPHQEAIQQFDLLVVGGGSLWPQHSFFALGDDYARSLRIPYMVLGVSARSYDKETARRTRALIDRAVLFHVRDMQTAQWLDHPKVHSGPDLFWTAPWFGDSKITSMPGNGIAFAPRSTVHAEWAVATCMKALQPFGQVHPWPFFYGDPRADNATANDFDLLHAEIEQTPQSFTFEPLFLSAAAFTMRYHGLLCALRAGRPVLVGDTHAKLEIFCRENGLPSWHVSSPAALAGKAQDLRNNLESGRNIALNLRTKLLAEGQSLAQLVRERTKALPPRKIPIHRVFLANQLRNVLARIS